jgi:hypothetical protein
MKVIRAHDYLRPEAVPDFKALRRILTAFFIGLLLCVVVCVAAIFHDAQPVRKVARRCTCEASKWTKPN